MKCIRTRGVIWQSARHTVCAITLSLCVASACISAALIRAQQSISSIMLDGTIRDEVGNAVDDAAVFVNAQDGSQVVSTKSNAQGRFRVILHKAGTYRIGAEKTGVGRAEAEPARLELGVTKRCDLVLSLGDTSASSNQSGAASTCVNSSATSPSAAGGFELNDAPNFTVAGVTDWSNAGLHGSDARARTSDALTKETAALTNDSGHKSPRASSNPAYDLAIEYRDKGDFEKARAKARKGLAAADSADGHRLLGELDERLGDSLAAVREFERAAAMDASEQNYFAWGAELLLHKAPQPAAQVFAKGWSAHPESARLVAGLGAALYTAGSYDEAARHLCAAADLQPSDPAPYLFLGQIEESSPAPFSCSQEKLARFVQNQPQNALANYYYAMSLWKSERESQRQSGSTQAERLLENALELDPKLTDAYVQLGVLRAARGDFGDAIENYKKALAVDPSSSDAHYRLGLAYKRTGQEAQARQEFAAFQRAQKSEAASAERQRRALKQFSITFKDSSSPAPARPQSDQQTNP